MLPNFLSFYIIFYVMGELYCMWTVLAFWLALLAQCYNKEPFFSIFQI